MSTEKRSLLRKLTFSWGSFRKTTTSRERPRRQGSLETLENRSLMAADLINYASFPQLYLENQAAETVLAGVERVDQNIALPVFTLTAQNATVVNKAAAAQTSVEFNALQAKLKLGTQNSSGQYALGDYKLGSFKLSNVSATPTSGGIQLSADLTMPVFGKVKLSGVLAQDGTFNATMPDRELLGGLVQVKNTTITLRQDLAKIEADFLVPNLGISSKLTGSIKGDGTYSLEASAKFNVAGFEVNAGKFTIGDKLKVNFTLPIPALGGNVTFKGEYGTTGWAIEGRVPVTIQIGMVTLKEIIVGVAKDQSGDVLKLGAKGTIANLSGFVDATAIAKIYTDGRINLEMTANALKLSGFSAGNVRVTVANDTPAGRDLYVATLQGDFQIPGLSSPLKLSGELRSNGYYRLTGEQSLQIAGLNLSQAKFEWIKGEPASFSALLDYAAIQVKVTGSIATNGRVQFQGTGTAKIGNGFNIADVIVRGDLNPAAKTYKLHVEGVVDVLVGNVKISADVAGNGKTWPVPKLTGNATIGGLLGSVFSGEANFTIEQDRVSFSGQLGVLKLPGLNASVNGSISADGKLSYDAKNSAGEFVTRLWRDGVKEVTQWLENGQVVSETIVENAVTTLKIIRDNAGKLISEYWRDGAKEFQNLYTNGIRTTYTAWVDGIKTARDTFSNAGEHLSGYWRDGAKEITQWYNNGKVAGETVVQNGIKLTDRAWKDGVNTLNIMRDTAGRLLLQYWRDGAKEFKNVYTNGVRVAYEAWENGVNTARDTWNMAGQHLTGYWRDGAKQISQWYTNGKVSAETVVQNGVKLTERAWKDGVTTLNIVRDTANRLVSMYWRDGSKEVSNAYNNGKLVVQNVWNNGKNIARHVWNSSGNYVGDALSKGANEAKKWFDRWF